MDSLIAVSFREYTLVQVFDDVSRAVIVRLIVTLCSVCYVVLNRRDGPQREQPVFAVVPCRRGGTACADS